MTRRADPNGGPDIIGRYLVHIGDPQAAEAAVQKLVPGGVVIRGLEATHVDLDADDVEVGSVFVRTEG